MKEIPGIGEAAEKVKKGKFGLGKFTRGLGTPHIGRIVTTDNLGTGAVSKGETALPPLRVVRGGETGDSGGAAAAATNHAERILGGGGRLTGSTGEYDTSSTSSHKKNKGSEHKKGNGSKSKEGKDKPAVKENSTSGGDKYKVRIGSTSGSRVTLNGKDIITPNDSTRGETSHEKPKAKEKGGSNPKPGGRNITGEAVAIGKGAKVIKDFKS